MSFLAAPRHFCFGSCHYRWGIPTICFFCDLWKQRLEIIKTTPYFFVWAIRTIPSSTICPAAYQCIPCMTFFAFPTLLLMTPRNNPWWIPTICLCCYLGIFSLEVIKTSPYFCISAIRTSRLFRGSLVWCRFPCVSLFAFPRHLFITACDNTFGVPMICFFCNFGEQSLEIIKTS